MKWELLIIPFWIIAIYLVVLSPALLLAALTYRWNKVLLALVHNPVKRAAAPEAPFRAGLWLFRKSMTRLSPPWYAILAFLIFALIVHALQPDKVSTLHKLHWLGLHLSVEIATILAALSGTMLFADRIKTPGRLLWAGILWVVGSWIVIWLCTPTEIVEATHRYYWGASNFTSVPTYPLVLPVYAVAMFVLCVYWAGVKLKRLYRSG